LISLRNYFHTLRYLRPIQIFGRVRFKMYRPRADQSPAPPLRGGCNGYVAPLRTRQSMCSEDQFIFLNREGNCSEAAHWRGQGHSRLWTYNLHYFDDLNAENNCARRPWHDRLAQRWIDENPPGSGIGWDSYPVSRRVVNWIKWSLQGNLLTPQARQSLAVQARWLRRRIETHLQGNHVFANAKALVFLGIYFSSEESEEWLRQGLSLMQAELAEQVLSDGGHFERSPMYHAAFVEDLLDVTGVLQSFGFPVDQNWRELAARMILWLEAMSHPDGALSFFNDSAFGVAPTCAQLRGYAARLGVELQPPAGAGAYRLMPSGYISVDSPPFFLICDVAPLGPDHLPGHGHADTLSFELSFKGRRIFVNSGTSEYGHTAERQRQRGTAAHCTLVVDGENSSEVWSDFRVARRARARLLEMRVETASTTISGDHDGYRRLPGKNVHRRTWTLSAHGLTIEDTVEGPYCSADCYFHLHPDIQVLQISEFGFALSDLRGRLLEMQFHGAARVEVAASSWHPEFGVTIASSGIVARLSGTSLKTVVRPCPA
jgi:uncharacterized heparinase superfamily protein